MDSRFKLPTEVIDLPSKGLLYPETSPLSSGTIEMKYMTAKEEDILTNQNYLRQGNVIDKLLQSLIVTENVDYNELLVGDKNALMIAARILSYGKDYTFMYDEEEVTVDLSEVKPKEVDYSLYTKGSNSFSFSLPSTGNEVKFKLLTHGDENLIEKEIAGLKKLNKHESKEITTRLKHIITSINGLTEQKDIREFVDNYLLAKDARALRDYYSTVSPDIDLSIEITKSTGEEEVVDIPITFQFFWPES